jgi:protein TonB
MSNNDMQHAHSTPDPDLPDPQPTPVPDDVPAPTNAPVEEPMFPEPPIKAAPARVR